MKEQFKWRNKKQLYLQWNGNVKLGKNYQYRNKFILFLYKFYINLIKVEKQIVNEVDEMFYI